MTEQPNPRKQEHMSNTIKVTTAWAYDPADPGTAPRLLSAYDEYTAEDWNGEPLFYREEISKGKWSDKCIVRELTLNVPEAAIASIFAEVSTPVEVES